VKIITLLFLSIYSLPLCTPCFLRPHDTLLCMLILLDNYECTSCNAIITGVSEEHNLIKSYSNIFMFIKDNIEHVAVSRFLVTEKIKCYV